MGKKGGAKAEGEEKNNKDSEGHNLLGSPTFQELGNGRYKCVETGHELPAQSRDSYSHSKHCRFGLIDSALSKNKPPLNMFRQDPQSRSKLICKLTGDTINKNEEHIWKHINGKRFLNMLERKEVEQQEPNAVDGEKNEKRKEKKKKANSEDLDKKKMEQEEDVRRSISEVRDQETDSEEDPEFWMPPVGDRWDNDDGGDRWGSDQDDDADEKDGDANGDNHTDAELSRRAKRISLEVGPSSFASRKKKKKTTAT